MAGEQGLLGCALTLPLSNILSGSQVWDWPIQQPDRHKDQSRLEIPLLDFLVLFKVSMQILPPVLEHLLEEV